MLKNLSKLELVIENKLYQLLCDHDSPLASVKEFLFQCQKYIGQIEDNLKAQQDQVKPEPDIKPEEQEKVDG